MFSTKSLGVQPPGMSKSPEEPVRIPNHLAVNNVALDISLNGKSPTTPEDIAKAVTKIANGETSSPLPSDHPSAG